MPLNRMVGGFFGKPNTIEQKAKQSTSPITLRFLTEMVYVNPPASLEECINLAQDAFPQLAKVSRERIAFSVMVRIEGKLHPMCIQPNDFDRVIRLLSPYEVADVSVLPMLPSYSMRDTLPQYTEKAQN